MSRPERGRRALTIGVTDFHNGLPALDFAAKLVPRVSTVLDGLGYDLTELVSGELTSAQIGAKFTEVLTSAGNEDVLVVHVLSHGEIADGGDSVYVLGSDGRRHPDADVGHWLHTVQNVGGPLTLFLLDLCCAGAVARMPWQSRIAADRSRAWVIAACQGDEAAFDGRFSQAVANVLHDIGKRELDIGPAAEYVPLPAVAQAIRRDVQRLATEADAYRQTVTASMLDISAEVVLPFFANPDHLSDERSRLRAGLNPGLVPFLDDLDEGLDARHFLDRAAGFRDLGDRTRGLIGCFSGRERELRALSPWVNGVDRHSLCVVTGSPGVGKSALLGVLVCAAHGRLREQTRPLWDRVAQAPYQENALVAVHARQRGLVDIVRSVAAQLGLGEPASARALIDNMRESPHTPVIVLDALDEAEEPGRILDELLIPLQNARREHDSAVARLLVGVRPYEEFTPLLDMARREGLFIDLDKVAPDVLEDDLHKYVTELLRTIPSYRRNGASTGAFASEVAHTLAKPQQDRGTQRWGSFLVAGLYTRYLVAAHPDGGKLTSRAATRLGGTIPRSLPDVLELDLAGQDTSPLLRPVMTALAHARGQGMPLTVLTRVAQQLIGTPLTVAKVREVLSEARFYLRQSTDLDQTTVYRLFHQGLADHLAAGSIDTDTLLTAFLAALGPANARDWAAAEPYVLRHVLTEAESAGRLPEIIYDPGFLTLPDAVDLLSAVSSVPAKLRFFAMGLANDPAAPTSLALLGLHAMRAGIPKLRDRIARSPHAPLWRPSWWLQSLTTGSAANAVTQYANPTTPLSPVTSVAMSGDGRSVAFSRGITGAEWLHLASGAYRVLSTADAVVAVNRDGSIVVVVTPDGECMTDWDGIFSAEKVPIAEVGAIALSAKGTRQAMVAKDGTLWIRDLASGVVATLPPENRTRRWVRWHGDALTIVELKDHTLGLSGGDRYFDVPDSVVGLAMSGDGLTLAWFDLHGDIHVLKNLRHARTRQASKYGWPTAVALSADGTWLVVGDEFGFLSLYRTTSLLNPAAIKRVDDGAISTVDVDDEGTAVVFGLENGTVSTWCPSTRTDTGVSRQVPITALGRLMPGRLRTSRPFLARRDRVSPIPRTDDVVLVGDRLGKVNLVDVRTGATSPVLAHGGGPVSSILTQDTGDAVLAHIRRDDDPLILHSESMHLFPGTTWPGCLDEAQLTALSRTIPDTRILLEIHGTESGTVALRDVAAQHDVATVPNAHVGAVTAAGVGPARTVWTGGADGKVRLWRVEEDPYALVPQHVVEVPGPVQQAALGTTDLLVLAMGEVYAFHSEPGTDTGPGGTARAR